MTTETRANRTEARERNGELTADRKFRQALVSCSKKVAPYLPPGHDPAPYFAAAAAAAKANPKIYTCSIGSVLGALVRVVQTGLTVGVTCFLVPYWNKSKRAFECTFVAHYKGLIELAYDSGHVCSIHAVVVREGEFFKPQQGDSPKIDHSPMLDRSAPIVGAYAVARMVGGGKIIAILSAAEVEAIRQEFSARWKEGPLPEWYAKKTAIRQLANHNLPMSRTMRLAVAADRGEKLHTWAEVQQLPDSTVPQDGVVYGAASRPQLPPGERVSAPIKVTHVDAIPAELVAARRATARAAAHAGDPLEPYGMDFGLLPGTAPRNPREQSGFLGDDASDVLPWDTPEDLARVRRHART